jgi:hypothetical protein
MKKIQSFYNDKYTDEDFTNGTHITITPLRDVDIFENEYYSKVIYKIESPKYNIHYEFVKKYDERNYENMILDWKKIMGEWIGLKMEEGDLHKKKLEMLIKVYKINEDFQ